MLVKTKNFSETQLENFLVLQKRSFSILERTASELCAGQTEKQVAKLLYKRYLDAGFTSFFHLPVVLFGARTALPGNFTLSKFFPKQNQLMSGDSVIMDASPISQGYLVDTSYSFCFGENAAHAKMISDLVGLRSDILTKVNQGSSFKSIAQDVELQIGSMGYEPVHHKHPGEVLGHRAVKLTELPLFRRSSGFDAFTIAWFKMHDGLASLRIGAKSPLWNTSIKSDHKPYDGLWLVEPHAANGSMGAKWEEILVIDDGVAYWLESNPPHVRQARQIAKGGSYFSSGRV